MTLEPPPPWSSVTVIDPISVEPTGKYVLAHGLKAIAIFDNEADCDFVAKLRNAFEVMVRRDLFFLPDLNRWAVGPASALPNELLNRRWSNPLDAILGADEWLNSHGR